MLAGLIVHTYLKPIVMVGNMGILLVREQSASCSVSIYPVRAYIDTHHQPGTHVQSW